jgi:hypothetical protein
MKPLRAATLALAALTTNSAVAGPRPLGPDEAGVVGGWSGSAPITGLVLREVIDSGGCLKFGPRSLNIIDHGDINHAAVATVVRVKPGRFAVARTRWSEAWFDQYDMIGVSQVEGDLWVVDLAAGAVTDVGVWPITSPYAHRYVPGVPDFTGAQAAARAAAEGVAPLVPARWERAPVVELDTPCLPANTAGK